MNDPGDLAAWASVCLTVLAAGGTIYAFVTLRRRDKRQALTDLHTALTTGETAAARNTLGTLLYSVDDQVRPPRADCIAAYFALIWSLQRAQNVFLTHGVKWKALHTPQRSLTEVMARGRRSDAEAILTWNLNEIAESVVLFHHDFGGRWAVTDDDAWKDISRFIAPAEFVNTSAASERKARQ